MTKLRTKIIYLILFCVIGSLSAQKTKMFTFKNDDYSRQWSEVTDLEAKGQTQTAKIAVEKILKTAIADDVPTQIIKAILHREKYNLMVEDDGLLKSIMRLETEIKKSNFPERPILESITAELLNNYIQQNGYRINRRTSGAPMTSDISIWTLEQLVARAQALYWSSLSDERIKKVAIGQLESILLANEFTKADANQLTPTLYDFLAIRALDYFSNENAYLTQPAYRFEITNKDAFAKCKTFINAKFESKDSLSTKLATLHLYQDLLLFHIDDKEENAKANIDLKRLEFVKNNATFFESKLLYIKTLEDMEVDYAKTRFLSKIHYLQGNHYYDFGTLYNEKTTPELKFHFKKALEIFKKGAKDTANIAGNNCRARVAQITKKSLDLQSEIAILPEKPSLLHVRYTNVNSVFFRILKFEDNNDKVYLSLNYELGDEQNVKRIAYLKSLPVLLAFGGKLIQDGDYRIHSTEVKIDALPIGRYAIIASDNQEFKNEDVFNVTFFTATNIAGFSKNDDNKNEILVAHRQTGAPLKGVIAELFTMKEKRKNENETEYVKEKIGNSISNEQGIIDPNVAENIQNYTVRFVQGIDTLDFDGSFGNYRNPYQTPEIERNEVVFFTDRAIYRPGQTIYFKGLALKYDKNGVPKAATDLKKIDVSFLDVNGQEIKKINLDINDFGSFTGAFTAPTSGLNGQMTIKGLDNYAYFKVEEYKRPKFATTFKPIEGSFRLNDKIEMKGIATAFAGNALDGAIVKYRVERSMNYNYYDSDYRRYYYPQNAPVEILNGEMTTDALGEFKIAFTALADNNIEKNQKQTYNFVITADVTDINGETHSSTTTVVVSYESLLIDFNISDNVNIDSLKSINISTTNFASIAEPVNGLVKILSLRSPKVIYQKRYWPLPDRPLFSKKEFADIFPTIPFADEDEIQKWEVKSEIINSVHNTKTELNVAALPWEAGAYCIVFETRDKFGTAIEKRQYFTVQNQKDKVTATNETLFVDLDKPTYKAGETAVLNFGTSEPEGINIYLEIQKKNDITLSKWLTVSGKTTFSIPLSQDDKSGIWVRMYIVKNNRVTTSNQFVYIPFIEKELKIETTTFRDKLYPGQDETWGLKISGINKDKAFAEILASMYDMSLDQFVPHNWQSDLIRTPYYGEKSFYAHQFSAVASNSLERDNTDFDLGDNNYEPTNRSLNWFELQNYLYGGGRSRLYSTMSSSAPVPMGATLENKSAGANIASDAVSVTYSAAVKKDEMVKQDVTKPKTTSKPVQIRKNLNETVFFLPNLQTDEQGNVIIKFKMNEALTRWKFMAVAHTKDFAFGSIEKEIVTQKELMVQPNPPRFLREGDRIQFVTKIVNISKTNINGDAKLELFDPISMKSLDAEYGNTNNVVKFTTTAGQSTTASWTLNIPENGLGALQYRITALSTDFSDGEENALPILTNRMLLTETKPLQIRANETKTFTFDAFAKANSTTLKNHKMTLEYTSNPAWYALQALPYMMDYPHECSEQVFSRYFANALASQVVTSQPKIKAVFDKWRELPEALMSNLQKNEDLKTALLSETPWVLAAQSETQQKKDIALLFDINKMAAEQTAAITKLKQRQNVNTGGFPWFPTAQDDWYITQHIVEGLGHLKKLNIAQSEDLKQIQENAVRFCDYQIVKQYEHLLKYEKKVRLENDHLDWMTIHYLHARSYFAELPKSEALQKAETYYMRQIEKYWLDKGFYAQSMIANTLFRAAKPDAAKGIIRSLRENAMRDADLGMSWKNPRGYYWYNSPIEMQAQIIESFSEITPEDLTSIEDMKLWLLKNKETNNWKTIKATANAVYVLLLSGNNWLAEDKDPDITIGNKPLDLSKVEKEPGTGYFKKAWNPSEIDNSFLKITVKNNNSVPNWGSLYWQYFEQLDKIKTFEDTPLKLKKKLFKVENSDRGPKLTAVAENAAFKIGDKIKVRIEIKVDRPMEYVHLKDMRASGFEPTNVISQYKYQDGLGYYESTKDASTNFFISYLPKGSYVFEYELIANNKGNFSNGVTSLQCMYAPQYASHSEGIRVNVD